MVPGSHRYPYPRLRRRIESRVLQRQLPGIRGRQGQAPGGGSGEAQAYPVQTVEEVSPESVPLRVAIPDMVSPSYFPAIAAVELGFFKREGLDATIELLFPVTRTYEALRDGQLDFVGGAAHAPLYAFKDWRGAKLLCALAQNMYWFLIVRSDLRPTRGNLGVVKNLKIGAAA